MKHRTSKCAQREITDYLQYWICPWLGWQPFVSHGNKNTTGIEAGSVAFAQAHPPNHQKVKCLVLWKSKPSGGIQSGFSYPFEFVCSVPRKLALVTIPIRGPNLDGTPTGHSLGWKCWSYLEFKSLGCLILKHMWLWMGNTWNLEPYLLCFIDLDNPWFGLCKTVPPGSLVSGVEEKA